MPASGTVSRCPPKTTRSARPSCVRAMTVLPSRSTSSQARAGQRCLDRVGERRLVVTLGRHVDQGGGQCHDVLVEVEVDVTHGLLAHRYVSPRDAKQPAPTPTGASGHGVATYAADGTLLDAWFPAPALGLGARDVDGLAALVGDDELRGVHVTAGAHGRSRPEPPGQGRRGHVPAPAPALAPARAAARAVHGRRLRPAAPTSSGRPPGLVPSTDSRRRDCACAVPGRSPCTGSTSSRGWSTTSSRRAYASPTPTGCGSARTWPAAPR